MRRILTAVVVLLLVGSVAACSVPTDGSAAVIDEARLPESLRSSTTTTSTPVEGENTRRIVYYLISPESELERATVEPRASLIPYTEILSEIIAPLFRDDFAAEYPELSNQVPAYGLDAIDRADDDSTVVTVRLTLDGESQDNQLREMAAQLVWTLTELDTVDKILVTINGTPADLPTSEGNKSEAVGRSDYARYDPDYVSPDATTVPDNDN